MLGTAGFLTALKQVCRTRSGGLLFAGVPCNTCLGFMLLRFGTVAYIYICEGVWVVLKENAVPFIYLSPKSMRRDAFMKI